MDKQVRVHLGKLRQQIVQWLAVDEAPTRDQIESVKWDLDLLLFLGTPRRGWEPSPAPTIHSPICAEPGCKAGWREGLVNHAQPENDPVWYCRKHSMEAEIGGHMPPSSPIELKPRHDRAVEMAGRWAAYEAKLAEQLKAEAENERFDWRER